MRVIKRYNNRKLYDTKTRTYITLDGVAKLVTSGEDVRVVDNETEEDITTVVFSQILLERERAQRFLPTAILSQLLRAGTETAQRLTRPFSGPFTQFLEQEVERTFNFWMDLSRGREEDILAFLERLIEQRRARRAAHPQGEEKAHSRTGSPEDVEELTPD